MDFPHQCYLLPGELLTEVTSCEEQVQTAGCPSRSQEVDQVHTDLPGALPFKNKLQLLQNSGKNSKSGSQDRARHVGPRASDGINMVQS